MRTKVIRYYSKEFKSWCFYLQDDTGNQLCEAMYQYTKPTIKECREALERYQTIKDGGEHVFDKRF